MHNQEALSSGPGSVGGQVPSGQQRWRGHHPGGLGPYRGQGSVCMSIPVRPLPSYGPGRHRQLRASPFSSVLWG